MTQADPGERRAIDARFSPLFQRGYPATDAYPVASTKARNPAPEDRAARPVQAVPPVAASSALDERPDSRGTNPGVDELLADLDAEGGVERNQLAGAPASVTASSATPLASVRILRMRLATLLTVLSVALAAAGIGAFYWSWNAQRSTAFFSGDGTLGTDTAMLFATTQFAAAAGPLVFTVGLGTAIGALVLTASARRNR